MFPSFEEAYSPLEIYIFISRKFRKSGFHLEIFVWGGTGEVDSIVSL